MQNFIYNAQPARIIFGSGSIARLEDEVSRLGLKRLMILSTPMQKQSAEMISDLLGDSAAAVFAGATMHTPVSVTEEAMRLGKDRKIDGVVAIGGGSTIGLGKAIALRTDLPQIVIPTTYAGSEVTPIIGETSDGVKSTQTTSKVLPEIVIYDVDLTLGLPVPQSVTSGMNALAHAVEALYARDGNPIIDIIAIEGARAIVRSLPRIVMNAKDEDARSDAQYGAWLCGTCLGSVGMSLHHKLCHTLGGTFNLPHAETHTAVLPHALAYNAPAAAKAVEALGNVLESNDPALAIYNLVSAMGAPLALRDLGMPEEGIEHATDLALTNAYWNPRPMERDAIRACIASAWAGEPPATTY